MPDEMEGASVYGENVGTGGLEDERGIREETVEAHPQPTSDAAADVKERGAEAVEGSEGTVEEDEERVRTGESVG